MTTPYYEDDQVTLYHGDCREVLAWDDAHALITDPPYGRDWQQRDTASKDPRYRNASSNARKGIAGDKDTSARDDALMAWGNHGPAAVFGDLMLAPPALTKHVLIYAKPPDAGQRGGVGGFRRDVEAVYLMGKWPTNLGGRSAILSTRAANVGGQFGLAARYGHPHAKPIDIMAGLIDAADLDTGSTIADPFAGSGSTLAAAKQMGYRAIGVEVDERYCEVIARRLSEETLFGGVA